MENGEWRVESREQRVRVESKRVEVGVKDVGSGEWRSHHRIAWVFYEEDASYVVCAIFLKRPSAVMRIVFLSFYCYMKYHRYIILFHPAEILFRCGTALSEGRVGVLIVVGGIKI